MRRLSLTLLALLALSGCAETKVSLATGPREYVASDYNEVLERWTREESLVLVEKLDDLLTVTATFESWDFRWAYVVRYARDYRLTVDQRRALLDTTLNGTRESHRFYVALYGGSNPRATDISNSNSAWVVRLIDSMGNETAPSKIEPIKKPGPLERTYFPYTTPWRQVFRITFPRTNANGPSIAERAKWFGLRFAGAEGNKELRWEVAGGAEGAL